MSGGHGHAANDNHAGHDAHADPPGIVAPKSYHPFEDADTHALLGQYDALHDAELVGAERHEMAKHKIAFRTMVAAHYGQHADETGKASLNLRSYKSLANGRKLSQDLVDSLTLSALAQKYKKSPGFVAGIAALRESDPEGFRRELEKYAVEMLGTDRMRSYEDLVDKIHQSENILHDLETDRDFQNMMTVYGARIIGNEDKRMDVRKHLSRRARTNLHDYETTVHHVKHHAANQQLEVDDHIPHESLDSMLANYGGIVNPRDYGIFPSDIQGVKRKAANDNHAGHDAHAAGGHH